MADERPRKTPAKAGMPPSPPGEASFGVPSQSSSAPFSPGQLGPSQGTASQPDGRTQADARVTRRRVAAESLNLMLLNRGHLACNEGSRRRPQQNPDPDARSQPGGPPSLRGSHRNGNGTAGNGAAGLSALPAAGGASPAASGGTAGGRGAAVQPRSEIPMVLAGADGSLHAHGGQGHFAARAEGAATPSQQGPPAARSVGRVSNPADDGDLGLLDKPESQAPAAKDILHHMVRGRMDDAAAATGSTRRRSSAAGVEDAGAGWVPAAVAMDCRSARARRSRSQGGGAAPGAPATTESWPHTAVPQPRHARREPSDASPDVAGRSAGGTARGAPPRGSPHHRPGAMGRGHRSGEGTRASGSRAGGSRNGGSQGGSGGGGGSLVGLRLDAAFDDVAASGLGAGAAPPPLSAATPRSQPAAPPGPRSTAPLRAHGSAHPRLILGPGLEHSPALGAAVAAPQGRPVQPPPAIVWSVSAVQRQQPPQSPAAASSRSSNRGGRLPPSPVGHRTVASAASSPPSSSRHLASPPHTANSSSQPHDAPRPSALRPALRVAAPGVVGALAAEGSWQLASPLAVPATDPVRAPIGSHLAGPPAAQHGAAGPASPARPGGSPTRRAPGGPPASRERDQAPSQWTRHSVVLGASGGGARGEASGAAAGGRSGALGGRGGATSGPLAATARPGDVWADSSSDDDDDEELRRAAGDLGRDWPPRGRLRSAPSPVPRGAASSAFAPGAGAVAASAARQTRRILHSSHSAAEETARQRYSAGGAAAPTSPHAESRERPRTSGQRESARESAAPATASAAGAKAPSLPVPPLLRRERSDASDAASVPRPCTPSSNPSAASFGWEGNAMPRRRAVDGRGNRPGPGSALTSPVPSARHSRRAMQAPGYRQRSHPYLTSPAYTGTLRQAKRSPQPGQQPPNQQQRRRRLRPEGLTAAERRERVRQQRAAARRLAQPLRPPSSSARAKRQTKSGAAPASPALAGKSPPPASTASQQGAVAGTGAGGPERRPRHGSSSRGRARAGPGSALASPSLQPSPAPRSRSAATAAGQDGQQRRAASGKRSRDGGDQPAGASRAAQRNPPRRLGRRPAEASTGARADAMWPDSGSASEAYAGSDGRSSAISSRFAAASRVHGFSDLTTELDLAAEMASAVAAGAAAASRDRSGGHGAGAGAGAGAAEGQDSSSPARRTEATAAETVPSRSGARAPVPRRTVSAQWDAADEDASFTAGQSAAGALAGSPRSVCADRLHRTCDCIDCIDCDDVDIDADGVTDEIDAAGDGCAEEGLEELQEEEEEEDEEDEEEDEEDEEDEEEDENYDFEEVHEEENNDDDGVEGEAEVQGGSRAVKLGAAQARVAAGGAGAPPASPASSGPSPDAPAVATLPVAAAAPSAAPREPEALRPTSADEAGAALPSSPAVVATSSVASGWGRGRGAVSERWAIAAAGRPGDSLFGGGRRRSAFELAGRVGRTRRASSLSPGPLPARGRQSADSAGSSGLSTMGTALSSTATGTAALHSGEGSSSAAASAKAAVSTGTAAAAAAGGAGDCSPRKGWTADRRAANCCLSGAAHPQLRAQARQPSGARRPGAGEAAAGCTDRSPADGGAESGPDAAPRAGDRSAAAETARAGVPSAVGVALPPDRSGKLLMVGPLGSRGEHEAEALSLDDFEVTSVRSAFATTRMRSRDRSLRGPVPRASGAKPVQAGRGGRSRARGAAGGKASRGGRAQQQQQQQ